MTASVVSTGPTATATGANARHRDGGRLWKALREMTDDQRAQLQLKLAQWRAVSGDDSPRIVVVDGDEWAPYALVRTLLAHLRELAHEQSQVEASSDPQDAAEASKKPLVNDKQGQRYVAFTLQADEFPSLGAKPASMSAAAAPLAAKMTKRRITTTLIATDAPYAAVAVQPPPSSQSKETSTSSGANANANAPNINPWAKRDLLERRMAAAAPPVQSVSEPSPVKGSGGTNPTPQKPPPPPATLSVAPPSSSNPWMSPPASMIRAERKPPSLTLVGKPKRAKRAALLTASNNQTDDATPTTSPDGKHAVQPRPLEPVEANLQAARIYGSLIVQRLVPSVCGELTFLIGLLHRPSCAAASSSQVNSHEKCSHTNEFCYSELSSAFAAAAIETAEPTLVQLGSDMVQLVAKSLEDAKLCENLVSRLRAAMETREERRVQESAKMGCELPVETTGTAFRDYALPFCEDMDSRLNYRSPTESVIYSNREKMRDAFLSQLRAYQKRQNSLQGSLEASQLNGASSASQDAQQLLQDVMHENYWWFARFFVLELVQVGSNPLGESDKDLVMKIMEDKMVVKNPDRLRKLHRRFSSQKAPDPIAGGVSTTGFANNRSKPNNQQQHRQHGGNSSSKGDSKTRISPPNNTNNTSDGQHSHSGGDNKASTTSTTDRSHFLDHMRGFFSDNQAFFFHFLGSCDSYQFAQLVKHQLEAQFLTVWRAKAKADPRKDFTETVLRLKVLAKFIGFLRFSPQWHWSTLSTALSSNNPALDVAQREAVATLEQAQSPNSFDVLTLLEESIESGAIAKCIPWLCDYLTMITSDVLSSSTRYFHRVLMVLAFVHRSSILDNLGETGLYVAMQIERLFQLMAIDDLLPQALRWHHIADKPPAWMKSTTADALLKCDKPKNQHVDSLPFLYSKMFVEVCISELDDLRGFIQTRANPHHRKSSSTAGRRSAGDKAPTIRKVRPLQVMSEQQLDISTPTLAEESPERGNNDNDAPVSTAVKRGASENPLRDAFFKLYPQLKQAVEFVVDMVVTNMCEHALNKYVKPNADALIDSCVEAARIHAPSFTQLILHEFQVQLDERLEDFMNTTVSTALREATEQCEVRVAAALRPLIAPSIPSQLVTAATTIAQIQATSAITNLITRSLRTEFLKRIGQRKRSIVKEAGVAAAAAASAGSVASSGGSSDTDSVARALKFSFDESTDLHLSPLKEAMQAIKRNVVGMNSAVQASSPAGNSTAVRNKRMMASFTRFQRSFRDALTEAIDELGDLIGEMQVVLWSWSWRAVRLWLKAFTSLVADVGGDPSSPSVTAAHLSDFVRDLMKTFRVMSQLSQVGGDESTASPFEKLCRFVMQSAIDIPTTLAATRPLEELHDGVLDACAALLSETHGVAVASPSSTDEGFPSIRPHGEVHEAVLARAFPTRRTMEGSS